MIIEDGDEEKRSPSVGSSGCCVVLLGVGASAGAGWWVVVNYFV